MAGMKEARLTEQLVIMVEEEFAESVRYEASKRERSQSDILRDLIDVGIANASRDVLPERPPAGWMSDVLAKRKSVSASTSLG